MASYDTATSDAIRRQLAQLDADLNKQVATQRTYGDTGAAAIDQSYGELGGKLQSNLGDITNTVNRGRGQIGSDYDAAAGNIGQAEGTIRQLLGNQINLNSGNFNSSLQEVQRLGAENSAARANSLGSYEMLGTGNINAARQAIADAAAEGTNRKSDLQSQIAAQISDLQDSYNTNKSQIEVQLAQVLDQEKARQEEIALEREKMAQAAREAALSRAASKQSKGYGQGRSGLMAWAIENGIPKGQLDQILTGINVASQSGKYADAYRYVNDAANAYNKATNVWAPNPKGGLSAPKKVSLGPPISIDTLNAGLDVYYGRFA